MINLDSIPRDTVGLGSRVELEDLDEGGSSPSTRSWCPKRSTASLNRISLSSPLGSALIGKAGDDDIEVQTPKGKRSYVVRRLVTIHTILALESGENSQS